MSKAVLIPILMTSKSFDYNTTLGQVYYTSGLNTGNIQFNIFIPTISEICSLRTSYIEYCMKKEQTDKGNFPGWLVISSCKDGLKSLFQKANPWDNYSRINNHEGQESVCA